MLRTCRKCGAKAAQLTWGGGHKGACWACVKAANDAAAAAWA